MNNPTDTSFQRAEQDLQTVVKQQADLKDIGKYQDMTILLMKSKYVTKAYSDLALCCCTVTNPVRKAVMSLVLNPWFDRFFLVIIIANCIEIALLIEEPDSDIEFGFEIVFTLMYTVECVLKIITMGFLRERSSYLRDPWNVIDFTVVLLSWLGLIILNQNLTVLRIVRTLRPIRTLNSLPDLKVLVIAILKSIPLLVDIIVLIGFLLLVYGLFGIQFYAGMFRRRCYGDTGILEDMCFIANYCEEGELDCGNSGCESDQYCWTGPENPNYGVTSFDNIFASILTVFQCITLEGWSENMFYASRTTDYGLFNDIFFTSLIVIGAFFTLNLIAAVLYMKFHEGYKEQMRIRDALQDANKQSSEIEPQLAPIITEESCCNTLSNRQKISNLVQSKLFTTFMMVCIALNVLIMSTEYYGMTDVHLKFIDYSNIFFTGVFILELFLKLIGLGFKEYIKDWYNILDIILVTIGIIEMIVTIQTPEGQASGVLKGFRLFRVFRFAKWWKALDHMMKNLYKSLNSIIYLLLLMGLILFIYSLIGVQFFKDQFVDEQGKQARANFDSLYWSFITVFQILTGENWNQVMGIGYHSVGWGSVIYFVSLLIIGNYILLNLFLAILLQHFDFDSKGLSENILESEKDKKRREKTLEKLKRKAMSDGILLKGKTFFFFSETHSVRLKLKGIMSHPYFNDFIYCSIVFACYLLALDHPKFSNYNQNVLYVANCFVVLIFLTESVIKSIVMGFVGRPGTYLRSTWNAFDFFIVILCIIDWVIITALLNDSNYYIVKTFKAMRALRIFRLVSLNEKLKKVVTSVMRALPVVWNVFLISLLVYLIFGIMGVLQFKGTFYSCNDSSITLESECKGTFIQDGEEETRKWENSSFNFDYIFPSVMTLFEVSTLEMWPNIMIAAVDAVEPGKAPRENHNPNAALFFVIFIFIAAFFIMNLYVGAIIKKFNDIKDEMDGSFFLTPEQREWVKTQRFMVNCYPRFRLRCPRNKYRAFCFHLAKHERFEYCVIGIILLNVLVMCMVHYDMPERFEKGIEVMNGIFFGLFLIEILIKMLGFGFRGYLASKMNCFDCFIVLAIVIGMSNHNILIKLLAFRVFRIARLFKAIKVFKGLRTLSRTFVSSFPSLLNAGALLLMVYFLYAIIGMNIFYDLHHKTYINSDVNFETFYDSIRVMFITSTGENWNGIMHDSYCQEKCGDRPFAIIYWISFTFLATFMCLNIFIAVILDNFSTISEEDEGFIELNSKDMKKYEKAWSIFAPNGEHFIKTKYLPVLLEKLEAPLGFKGQALTGAQLLRIIEAFNIRDYHGWVHFAEVLWVLASTVSGADMRNATHCEPLRKIYKDLYSKYPELPVVFKKTSKYYKRKTRRYQTAAKALAALVIYKGWKRSQDIRNRREKLNEGAIKLENNLNLISYHVISELKESEEKRQSVLLEIDTH
jgi:voltage-dependent calcium channel L type alpha-1D